MEFTDYFRFLAALAFVVGLIGVLALGARRFGMTPKITRKPGQRGSRLSIVDMLPVDGKRRLYLIRRDAVEHLVMLGPTSEMVIERGIEADENTTAANSLATDEDEPITLGLKSLPSLLRSKRSGD